MDSREAVETPCATVRRRKLAVVMTEPIAFVTSGVVIDELSMSARGLGCNGLRFFTSGNIFTGRGFVMALANRYFTADARIGYDEPVEGREMPKGRGDSSVGPKISGSIGGFETPIGIGDGHRVKLHHGSVKRLMIVKTPECDGDITLQHISSPRRQSPPWRGVDAKEHGFSQSSRPAGVYSWMQLIIEPPELACNRAAQQQRRLERERRTFQHQTKNSTEHGDGWDRVIMDFFRWRPEEVVMFMGAVNALAKQCRASCKRDREAAKILIIHSIGRLIRDGRLERVNRRFVRINPGEIRGKPVIPDVAPLPSNQATQRRYSLGSTWGQMAIHPAIFV